MRTYHYLFTIPAILIYFCAVAGAAESAPSQSNSKTAVAEVGNEIYNGDQTQIDEAVAQIHVWLKAHKVNDNLWRHWLPDLMNAQRYQDVADLALEGAFDRPEGTDAILDFRVKALLAMGKTEAAIETAKSYYNVCSYKKTPYAVQLVALCLVKCHPDDPDVGRKFRSDQAVEAAPAAQSPDNNSNNATATTQSATDLTLKSITIDPSVYNMAIKDWSQRSVEFADQVSYGNVLLAADQAQNAEKVFRELYRLAATQKELTTATEGIARSMRAEDGNVARANAWLLSLQQNQNSQGQSTLGG